MVQVVSEFAPLKRVVVAQSEFQIPKSFDDVDFLAAEGQATLQEGAGLPFGQVFPEQQAIWEREREQLVAVLEKHGVEVERPRKLTALEWARDPERGVSNFFIRDPFFTVGSYLIEGSLRFAHRRDEILPARELLWQEMENPDTHYVAVPRPDTSLGRDAEVGPFLEGGDVLVYGKQVFVGNSGLASNSKGIAWLRHLLAPAGYQVEEVSLEPDVLHLDCAMSLVREGLMIVSPEAFVKGLPAAFESWDKILVPREQIAHLAVNGLPVSEKLYITDPAFKDLIGQELEKRGVEVEYVDFAISRSFGGSFRCSSQALERTF